MHRYASLFAAFSLCFLHGCGTMPPEEETLASLDIVDPTAMQHDVFVPHKSAEEIKAAYYAYIEQAQGNQQARRYALNRLADMEIELAASALKQTGEDDSQTSDQMYLQSLDRTRTLLETSLKDFPDEPNNDKLLYRLAHVYDQLGKPEASLGALANLVALYPESPHYAEAQFRLGERFFVEGDYISAEDAYTEVIYSRYNSDFMARAYFKRGWSRYKQGLYTRAAEDHLEAIRHQSFNLNGKLADDEQRVIDEHFRAIALAFAQLPDIQTLFEFFAGADQSDYLYQTCKALSEIYLYQERFSDAAQVLSRFVAKRPDDDNAAAAGLYAIEVWQSAGFRNRYLDELETFYQGYNPGSAYWSRQQAASPDTISGLKDHLLAAASHHHRQFADGAVPQAGEAGIRWYQRYLNHYSVHARKAGVHLLYGDLLASMDRKAEAIQQYEIAAFDAGIILDKTAAYATISLLSELVAADTQGADEESFDKYLDFAQRYARFYPDEPDTEQLVIFGAELAHNRGRHKEAIELASALPVTASPDVRFSAQLVRARSHLDLGSFVEAEELLTELLHADLDTEKRQLATDSLALLLYQRAESFRQTGNMKRAIDDLAHIAQVAPASDIAPQGLYDAVVLAMEQNLWTVAITHLKTFEKLFPAHERANDVTRRLSEAYLQSRQYAEAAETLEKVSSGTEDSSVQMAAMWQAAELYEQEGEIDAAIRTYRTYAHNYKRPYPQYMEAMYRLTRLYEGKRDDYRRDFWENRIAEADRNAPPSLRSDRTNFIAATTALQSARRKHHSFEQVELTEPLREKLRRKKQLMEEAIERYSRAASYNLGDVSTEATYSIANIYRHFAEALLDSERPAGLSGTELAQYEILIEDQAFPFEEMAVEFHEINISRIAQGTVNDWVKSSLDELRELFPVRYGRKGKTGIYRKRDS